MASIGISAATAAGTISGPWAFVAAIGASIVDSQFIMPRLAGRGRDNAYTPKLAGVPTGSNEPGAPRIWAIGQRVRVPCHVLWQSTKVREQQSNQKGASGLVQKRVFVDAALALNDRETLKVRQLIGNGKLLLWKSRNLVTVTTSEMSAAETGGQLVITMADQSDPDLSEYFEVGDGLLLTGWVPAAGTPSVNAVYWKVDAVTAHTSTATSTLTLDPVQGQTVTSANSIGGTPFSPATIERVDDAEVGIDEAFFGDPMSTRVAIQVRESTFVVGDIVTLRGMTQGGGVEFYPATRWRVAALSTTNIHHGAPDAGKVWATLIYDSGPQVSAPASPVTLTELAATNFGRVEQATPQTLVRSLFPQGFDPDAHFYNGTETQGEDSIIVADKGTGNVPGYRGQAYQVLDDFEVTQFGNGLPFSLETIIDVDDGMTWSRAVREILEWQGMPAEAIDVAGIDDEPFGGYYLRGSAPSATALQPLLVAGQIVEQDRDGVLSFFSIPNADVVQVENGGARTALAARLDGEQATDDKIQRANPSMEDLPTSVGIRHQDPDNAFAPGYQSFGIRNPSGVEWQNVRDVDLSTLVLSRKKARNLATTLVRRAWINSTTVEFQLDGRYIDLLENDLVTVTDDDGNDLVVRLTSVDIGANMLVRCVGVLEDVTLEVSGSPVQNVVGTYRRPPVQPAELDVAVIDIPALTPADAATPTLLIACAPQPGSTFQGAQVFESADGGNSWVPIGTTTIARAMGYVSAAVPAHAAAESFGSATLTYDTTTTITVDLTDGGYQGGLTSCTQAEAEQAGRNWCAILDPVTGVWEVLAFTTATALSATTYELTGLLRGLRGTWAAASTAKPAGGQFVLLTDWDYGGIRRAVAGNPTNASRLYRVVPVGATIDDVVSVGVTPTWRSASPPSPRRLTKTIGGSPYDADLETENESRAPLPLGQVGPYPMAETFEEYEFRIYDPTGSAVRRIKRISTRTVNGVVGSSNLRDRFVTYTAAEQTADGYTPSGSTSFVVDVVHVGDYGRSTPYKRTV